MPRVCRKTAAGVLSIVLLGVEAKSQSTVGQMADLIALKDKVGNADSRVRVDALHRVWTLGLGAGNSEIKLTAIGLLVEPAGSSSDHVRMPAVYAIADMGLLQAYSARSGWEPEARKRAQEAASRIEATAK